MVEPNKCYIFDQHKKTNTMKQFIIIPAHQTEGMYGYSAIAIEKTQDNLLMLKQYIRSMAGAKAIDDDISSLVYDNPKLDIEILNDE